MTWPQTNFRVVIGKTELGCAEVSGFGSQTAPASPGAAGVSGAAGADPTTGTPSTQTPWANDVGPWIGADPHGHPPGARAPALQWTLTPVTIRRALDQSQALFEWRSAVVAGQPDTRDVLIQLLDAPGGQPALTWVLHDAWPVSWSGPVLDALVPGVALEQAELAYARLQWLNPTETGEA
ncbi:MAG TPA: phage tail protein [Solirubrobacteraceae bacterium]|nr:phage tail protein [Solirubrobacteraceae bacterium]